MKRIRICAAAISFLMLLSTSMPVYAGTWTQHEDKTWIYVDNNGESLTGWIEDGEKTYYLDEGGVRKTAGIILTRRAFWPKTSGSITTM